MLVTRGNYTLSNIFILHKYQKQYHISCITILYTADPSTHLFLIYFFLRNYFTSNQRFLINRVIIIPELIIVTITLSTEDYEKCTTFCRGD